MAKQIVLVEIDFPNGTRRYSFSGVRNQTLFYEPKLHRLGDIVYEINLADASFNVGDTFIELIDIDREFAILRDSTGWYNSQVRVLFGDPTLGLAGLASLIKGTISGWSLKNGTAKIKVRDYRMGRFRQRLSRIFKTLNDTDYPNMPTNVKRGELIPIVYGNLASTANLAIGQVPAYLVDPAVSQSKFRYALAQHELKSVDTVYRYGEPTTTPTITFTGGVTYLDFDSDQRDFDDYYDRDYDNMVVSSGLVSRWLMNEGTGTTLDDDEDSNDGTLTGGSIEWLQSTHSKTGNGKWSVHINGGYLDFGTGSNLHLTGDLTVCIWVERSIIDAALDETAEETIVDCGEVLDTKGWRWYIKSASDGTNPTAMAFRTNTASAHQETISAGSFKKWETGDFEGKFGFFAVVKDSGVVKFYEGASEVVFGYASQPTHTDPVAATGNFRFGSSTASLTYQGAIAHMRVYNSALTAAQIAGLANPGYLSLTREDENEITADVQGVMDGGSNLVENGADQLSDFLSKAGVDAAEINSTIFSEASDDCTALGMTGAGAFVESDMTLEEAINQICKSYNMSLIFDEDGKYGAVVLHAFNFSEPLDHFTDRLEVLEESLSQEGFPEGSPEPASTLRYNYMLNWIRGAFEESTEIEDTVQTAVLGEEILAHDELDLWMLRDATKAQNVAEQSLRLRQEGRIYSSFDLPPELYTHRLGSFFRLSHFQGAVSSGEGFDSAPHRLIGLRFQLQPEEMRVSLIGLRLLADEG